ncbi:para-nitrobenzyl esterase [Talaromyces proteolyticus]|uniref:Para-nitrobenzyl esterase n=1 Tax=Talaromyces proteolyticus TaxID=1131652 RepID=A0AAD4KK47_9EURO|nr:para-nitrobenzyl esterase [Talaromyces proteolyticus]KAH8694081.1 para-nitrobenzyl esterase [Talaromyces proteolyticus]
MSLLLFCTAVLCCIAAALSSPRNGPHVNTSSGPVVGFIDRSIPNVHQYLGVPYAEPPLGNLKFLPPKAKSPTKSITLANTMPPNCMYWLSKLPQLTDIVTEYNPSPNMSEDCLYLNIFAPTHPTENKLPVLFWVYGGEWLFGGVSSPYELPQRWVSRSQDVIIVQVNYRVNVFGFPGARGLKDGERNVGLMDMRLGLEWVRDNIEKFGGDSDNIVLWGNAAGGASIDMLQFGKYAHDPIANGVIADSAVALLASNGAKDVDHYSFTHLAQQMGCPTNTSEAELDCMREVDPFKIENFLQVYSDKNSTPPLWFNPMADNVTVFTVDQYVEMGSAGNFSKLPMLTGSNSNEFAQLTILSDGQSPNLTEIRDQTIEEWQCPIIKTINYRRQAGALTYRWYYEGNFTNISPQPWMGAYHFSELPLLAGTHSLYRSNSTAYEYAVSHEMQSLWRAFAANPKNGLSRIGWPETGSSGKAMGIALTDEGQLSAGLKVLELLDSVPGDSKCA